MKNMQELISSVTTWFILHVHTRKAFLCNVAHCHKEKRLTVTCKQSLSKAALFSLCIYVLTEFNYFADWNLCGSLRPIFIVLGFDHRLVSSGKFN